MTPPSARLDSVSPIKTLLMALVAVMLLACLLVLTQWLSRQQIPVLELREVNLIDAAALPEPTNELPELIQEAPPTFVTPPPALELEMSPEAPILPATEALAPSFDVHVEMAEFALNTPPIDVQALPDPKPTVVKRSPTPRSAPRSRPTKASPEPPRERPKPRPVPTVKPAPKPQPAPKVRPPAEPAKSSYSAAELDRKPQLRTKPKAPFPHELLKQGVTSGNVILNVEIDTTGRVQVLGIASISHPELKPMAMQVARKARFTKPTKNGKPVKARFRWPLTLRK